MKKILFVINTMGYGGAERALLNLISALEKEQYEISVFVLTGQGELIHQIPDSVTLLNKNYKDVSVLTSKGRMELMKTILRAGILKGAKTKLNGGVISKKEYNEIRSRGVFYQINFCGEY